MAREKSTFGNRPFCFALLLIRCDFPDLVHKAGYPGAKMIPALRALLPMLALKLSSTERKSHVMDLVFDDGIALFAGLNVVPKTTYLATHSHSVSPKMNERLGNAWISVLKARNYCGASRPMRCWDLGVLEEKLRAAAGRTGLRFQAHYLRQWEPFESHGNYLHDPAPPLSGLAARDGQSAALGLANDQLDAPHRIYQTPKIVDRRITLSDYQGELRRMFITELGREHPTVLLTNDLRSAASKRITRYA
jgi:hypothetical protein